MSGLTERDHELLAMPTIMEQFPIVYPNKARWDQFDGNCAHCDQIIDRSHVRGLVSRPTPQVAVIESVGYCKPCNFLTRFNYRFHDDMRMTGKNEHGWQTWQAKPTLWVKIKKFLFN